jgi:hypothetical protein
MDDGNLLVERHTGKGVVDTLLHGLRFVNIYGQWLRLSIHANEK